MAESQDVESPPDPWKSLQDVIPFPAYVVDVRSLELLAVNRAAQAVCDARPGGPCYREIYHQERPCLHCALTTLLAEGAGEAADTVFEMFNDIDDRWYQVRETLIRWHDGRLAKYSVAVDITALKETQNALVEAHAELTLKSRELERLAITDQLTGLFNRRRLAEVFTHEVDRVRRYHKPLAAVLVDIDHFKSVNDTHGHQAGDAVLIALAAILTDGVRKVDTVGRWGGEEFVIVCPETDLAAAAGLAEKLRRTVAGHAFPFVGSVTASFGVACYVPGESVGTFVERTDRALYRAKQAGRNRVETASV